MTRAGYATELPYIVFVRRKNVLSNARYIAFVLYPPVYRRLSSGSVYKWHFCTTIVTQILIVRRRSRRLQVILTFILLSLCSYAQAENFCVKKDLFGPENYDLSQVEFD